MVMMLIRGGWVVFSCHGSSKPTLTTFNLTNLPTLTTLTTLTGTLIRTDFGPNTNSSYLVSYCLKQGSATGMRIEDTEQDLVPKSLFLTSAHQSPPPCLVFARLKGAPIIRQILRVVIVSFAVSYQHSLVHSLCYRTNRHCLSGGALPGINETRLPAPNIDT